jgi:hypothetical protein
MYLDTSYIDDASIYVVSVSTAASLDRGGSVQVKHYRPAVARPGQSRPRLPCYLATVYLAKCKCWFMISIQIIFRLTRPAFRSGAILHAVHHIVLCCILLYSIVLYYIPLT